MLVKALHKYIEALGRSDVGEPGGAGGVWGTHLVMCVGAGRVGRLPQNQQRGLVAEPHDELARRVRL